MNTFGNVLRLTTAGESHGPALTGILDGMPAGLRVDFDAVTLEMSRRRPGAGLGSKRREADEVTFLSGLLDGVTTGTPIAFTIPNSDAHSSDYDQLKTTFRPSHADFTYQAKYGIRDWRGGGRSSARETAVRVAAGSLALQALLQNGVSISAYTSQIGNIKLNHNFKSFSDDIIYSNGVRCPDPEVAAAMEQEVKSACSDGDTLGGVVSCVITGLPVGLGQPLYTKFSAMLASAMLSINAAHGFDFGMGFDGIALRGSELIDPFAIDDAGRIVTTANNSGGIQGGITNGAPVTFRVAFKPVATMMRPIESVNQRGERIVIEPRGRHDVCVVPRAVPVVKAMAALTVLDAYLMAKSDNLL